MFLNSSRNIGPSYLSRSLWVCPGYQAGKRSRITKNPVFLDPFSPILWVRPDYQVGKPPRSPKNPVFLDHHNSSYLWPLASGITSVSVRAYTRVTAPQSVCPHQCQCPCLQPRSRVRSFDVYVSNHE